MIIAGHVPLASSRCAASRLAPHHVVFVTTSSSLPTPSRQICATKATQQRLSGTAARLTVTTKAAAGSSGSGSDPHAGHAFLHDFCMAIPYGAIAVMAALGLVALGASATAVPCGAGGAVALACSVLSLKAWKKQGSTAPFTLIAGSAAGYVAYTCYMAYQSGIVPWLTATMTGLSAALCLFCFYNVAAGGNPPPSKK